MAVMALVKGHGRSHWLGFCAVCRRERAAGGYENAVDSGTEHRDQASRSVPGSREMARKARERRVEGGGKGEGKSNERTHKRSF